jgi:cation diffusion facilitator CzcD-associated flavoprotein CzcO
MRVGVDSTQAVVAVIGAGPYGISVAAHLAARGVPFRVFGPPMSFWRDMPPTLNLKSFAFATSLSVPHPHFTFPEYCRRLGLPDLEPCTMESFADYGTWVQKTLVPDVDPTLVVDVKREGAGFFVTQADGRALFVRSVVVATGLTSFAHIPPVLADLPEGRVSHTSDHRTFSAFRGKRVAVIGAGASAIESATLLFEAGAEPLLVARSEELVFHDRFDPKRSLRERLRQPNSVLGPGRKSWVLEHFPMAVHFVPEARRVRFTRRYLGPAGPWWIKDRFHGNVPFVLEAEVSSPRMEGDRVRLALRVGREERVELVDHVLAGTGFEVDVDRIPFLDRDLRARVRRVDGAPALSRHFESSVHGLYFVGAAAALSFGPLFRFVAGSRVAAPRVARHVARVARC